MLRDEATYFGALLRRYRLAADLTQEALAERAQVGVRSIQGIETGERHPRRGTVRQLARALGLSGWAGAQFEAAAGPAPRGQARTPPVSGLATASRPTAARHNLPVALTSFVGRERELAEVGRLLTHTRLLTLTGTGGCGKTRLAVEATARLVDSYPDGAWLVELAPLTDPNLVPRAVASVLGMEPSDGRDLLTVLIDRLRSNHVLLILDNCEHLIDASARLADTVLRSCSRVRILATSREPLGIAGEVSWRVPSLALPPDSLLATPEELAGHEAIRLFVDRASAAQSDFALTAQNAPLVAQICQRLDGIPLAIELAATRLRALSMQQIATRLDQRFALLARGSRTALPRQQTLRATVEWSYDLLTDAERVLFRRLAVFVGGFTLEAAEAICESRGPEDVVDLLSKLVDKSLVAIEAHGGSTRYHLLETLRAYAWERLAGHGEDDVTRRRHAAYTLALAESVKDMAVEPDAVEGRYHLKLEFGNLWAALSWYRGHDPEAGLRLAWTSFWWYNRDNETEAGRWLEIMLERTSLASPDRPKALLCLGFWATFYGKPFVARTALEECLTLLGESGDPRDVGRALIFLGQCARKESRYPEAQAHLERGIALARACGDVRWASYGLQNLGQCATREGDFARAECYFSEALALARAAGQRLGEVNVLCPLGDFQRRAGRFAEARATLETCLRLARELRHSPTIINSLAYLSRLARLQRDMAQARSCLDEALAEARRMGNGQGLVTALLELALLAQKQGDASAADGCFREGLEIVRTVEMNSTACEYLGQIGVQAVGRGEHVRGARLLSAANALDEWFRSALDRDDCAAYEAALVAARSALGAEGFELAWAEGQALSREQAIAEALDVATVTFARVPMQ